MSAVAQIAFAQGYEVSGCDLTLDSPYIDKVKNLHIGISEGHNSSHLQQVDILAVTPAVFYQNDTHAETTLARQKNILMKWQDFMGANLHKNKYLICVAGTHGKSTTTAIAGLLLEKAGLDPTVEVGATLKDWHNNVRLGQSKYFISEADEFHDNFATYFPDIILLTLVEYDHPEYFKSIDNMLLCYQRFINRLKPNGIVIYNADSPMCLKLKFPENSIPYHLSDFPEDLRLSQPGNHNKLNALAIIRLANVLKISDLDLDYTLRHFSGLDRRLDLIGEKHGKLVYDDYANHPSSFSATISAVKELHPHARICTVIEPHTFSRLRSLLPELPDSVKLADEVIVSKIFASRETDPGDFTGADIVHAMHHPHALFLPEFSQIISHIVSQKSDYDVYLIMGSGNSHKLSKQILENL
jgi:UDP-N-acetylmuramate--alanine ligase